ncbi:MAG: hypothetical protein D6732_14395 [Methanobacteriota archaeon]|nr:MAG: hypothetical protein D6732_14395 [Euryarchaeota archaeon]
MITIKILNHREIIEREKGMLISRLAPIFVDISSKVEEEIARQIQQVFEEKQIQAEISVEPD